MRIVRRGRPASAPGLLARLDALARALAPSLSTLALMVVAAAPVGLPTLVPAVALAGVFFWSLFRPASMPAPAVFGLGLLQDLLGFAPLGVGVLTLLLVHGAALRVRRVLTKQPFLLVWLTYCGFAAAVVALGYLLHDLLGLQILPVAPTLVQFGLAAGLYPVLAAPMSWAHRGMQRAEGLA